MCPVCHGRMPRCRRCEMQDVTAESTWLRDTEHLARVPLTGDPDTGYTMPAQPGRYTIVLTPWTGQLMLSTG